MDTFNVKDLKFTKSELYKAQIEFSTKKSGREGVDFILNTNTDNLHEFYLQPINLNKERSVKISKQDLGEPKDTHWVALVLILDNEAINLYM